MVQALDELRQRIAALDGQEQAALATEILDRLGGAQPSVEREWIDEAIRRNDGITRGEAAVHDADAVFAEIRKRLANRR